MRRALALALAVVACSDAKSHIFTAFPYDPDHDCLGSAVVVDVLQGSDPGPCNVVKCWVSPRAQAFVTDRACDAPPDFVDRTNDPPLGVCAKALAAYAKPGHAACKSPVDAGL